MHKLAARSPAFAFAFTILAATSSFAADGVYVGPLTLVQAGGLPCSGGSDAKLTVTGSQFTFENLGRGNAITGAVQQNGDFQGASTFGAGPRATTSTVTGHIDGSTAAGKVEGAGGLGTCTLSFNLKHQ